MLRGVTRSRTDKEYNFQVGSSSGAPLSPSAFHESAVVGCLSPLCGVLQVSWSDSSSSSVTRTHLELENFLLKVRPLST